MRDSVLAEAREARIVQAIGLYTAGKATAAMAASRLGVSERHFRRLRAQYEAKGIDGIVDHRRGETSGRRAAADKITWVINQYRSRYAAATIKQFHKAITSQGFTYSYTWTKNVLQRSGLAPPKLRSRQSGPENTLARPVDAQTTQKSTET